MHTHGGRGEFKKRSYNTEQTSLISRTFKMVASSRRRSPMTGKTTPSQDHYRGAQAAAVSKSSKNKEVQAALCSIQRRKSFPLQPEAILQELLKSTINRAPCCIRRRKKLLGFGKTSGELRLYTTRIRPGCRQGST